MGDKDAFSKLKKAKFADFWKIDFARPAVAIIALVLLMAIGNITKRIWPVWEIKGKKQIYFAYNAGVDTAAKIAGTVSEGTAKQIAKVKIGKEKFVEIAQDILGKEKIKQFEEKTGIALRGDQGDKANLVEQNQGGAVLGRSNGDLTPTPSPPHRRAGLARRGSRRRRKSSRRGRRERRLTNVGDIEVSAYLMDDQNKEIPNGEYDGALWDIHHRPDGKRSLSFRHGQRHARLGRDAKSDG